MYRRPTDLSSPIYLDAKWPYYEVDYDNLAVIIVSRTTEAVEHARCFGAPVGNNNITEMFESNVSRIDAQHYIYNGHECPLDSANCEFIITFKQKHYTSETGTSSKHIGFFNPKIHTMNSPKYISDYITLLHAQLKKVRVGYDEEKQIVESIESLLAEYRIV